MKVIYIGGPLRAAEPWLMEQNIRAAETLAMEVFRIGAFPYCVHSLGRYTETWRHSAMAGSMELLRRCDALILSAGWERSEGSLKERDEMTRLGRPVFYALDALNLWLHLCASRETEGAKIG